MRKSRRQDSASKQTPQPPPLTRKISHEDISDVDKTRILLTAAKIAKTIRARDNQEE